MGSRVAMQLDKLQQLRKKPAGAVDPAELGDALYDVADAHKALGRYEDAVPYMTQAVAAYRKGLAASLEASSPNSPKCMKSRRLLAEGLSGSALLYGNLNRIQQALVPAREALELCRELTRVNMAEYKSNLWFSCQQVSTCEAYLGNHATALELAKEAVKLGRSLVPANPAKYTKRLAKSIKDMGVRQRDLLMNEEAAQSTREAAKMYMALAEADLEDNWEELLELSDTFVVLQQRGSSHSTAEAQKLAEDTVRLRRLVVRARPTENNSRLAHALMNLGSICCARKQYKKALAATQEAVTLLRSCVAAGQPDMERSLSQALLNLYAIRMDPGRVVESPEEQPSSSADAIIKECVDLARRMERHRNASKYLDATSKVFEQASQHYLRQHNYEMAVTLARDALSAHRATTAAGAAGDHSDLSIVYSVDSATGLPPESSNTRVTLIENLVGALTQQAAFDRQAGDAMVERAVAATTEAIQYLRALAKVKPEKYRPILIALLNQLAFHEQSHNRLDKALIAVQESLQLQRRPPVEPASLTISLELYCSLLAKQGMYAESLAPAQEAIEILRKLPPGTVFDRHAIALRLGEVLVRLAEAQQTVGQNEAALSTATEAKQIFLERLRLERADGRPSSKVTASDVLRNLVTADVVLGRCHYSLQHYSEAIVEGEEAVRFCREASVPPGDAVSELDRYLPDTISQLVFWKLQTGAIDEAEALATEALALAREYDRKRTPQSINEFADILPLNRLAEVHMERGDCVRAMGEFRQLVERSSTATQGPADPLALTRVNAFVQQMATHLHRLQPGPEATATAAFVLARVPRMVAADPSTEFLAVAALAFASACATATGNVTGAQQFATSAVHVLTGVQRADRLVIEDAWW